MTKKQWWCNFCGQSDVALMLTGPEDVAICNECIAVANSAIAKHNEGQAIAILEPAPTTPSQFNAEEKK